MNPREFQSGASPTAPTRPASPSTGYPSAGNPGAGVAPTVPGPYWHHQIGEELRGVIAAAGLTPDATSLTQLLQALRLMFGTVLTHGSSPAVIHGLSVGGLILQWGNVTFTDVASGVPGNSGSITFQTPFSSACFIVIPACEVAAGGVSNWNVAITSKSTTGATYQVQEWAASANPGSFSFLAIGQ